MDETGAGVSQPEGLPGAGPQEKTKNGNQKEKRKKKKEKENSYEAVSGKEKTVNELVNEHEKIENEKKKKKVGTGLVGARISEGDGDRAGRDTEGLGVEVQQSRACGGDHEGGAGQPGGPGWEPRQAALRGWCWEHGQELVAAERALRCMSEVEVQHWAELARENRVQVARWCGAAAKRGRQRKLWAQAMQDGHRQWVPGARTEEVTPVVEGEPVLWAQGERGGRWWCFVNTRWGEGATTISRMAVRDLGLGEATVGDEVRVKVRVLGKRWSGTAVVHEGVEASMVLGAAAWAELQAKGLQRVAATEEVQTMLEREGGRVVDGRVEFGSVEELLADEDEVRQWDHWLLGQWQQRTEESLEEAILN